MLTEILAWYQSLSYGDLLASGLEAIGILYHSLGWRF